MIIALHRISICVLYGTGEQRLVGLGAGPGLAGR